MRTLESLIKLLNLYYTQLLCSAGVVLRDLIVYSLDVLPIKRSLIAMSPCPGAMLVIRIFAASHALFFFKTRWLLRTVFAVVVQRPNTLVVTVTLSAEC